MGIHCVFQGDQITIAVLPNPWSPKTLFIWGEERSEKGIFFNHFSNVLNKIELILQQFHVSECPSMHQFVCKMLLGSVSH